MFGAIFEWNLKITYITPKPVTVKHLFYTFEWTTIEYMLGKWKFCNLNMNVAYFIKKNFGKPLKIYMFEHNNSMQWRGVNVNMVHT
jgi:hypothetical protein